MAAMEDLIDKALQARDNAYVPYSGFKVGAALRASSGRVYQGCNVENASYGLSICAERVALTAAAAAGERHVVALAVVTADRELTPPCGACRQFLVEFAGDDVPVVLANVAGAREETTVGALLPRAFRSFGTSS